jgi:hypothetical protein
LLEKTIPASESSTESVKLAIQEATGRPSRAKVALKHIQTEHFKPGNPVTIELSADKKLTSAVLVFRHVNHAERFSKAGMVFSDTGFRATIPADYTSSDYPVQYYFELKDETGKAFLYPGFNADLNNQPYFVMRQT